MNKIQLYILDDDLPYVERLASFIRSTEHGERWQVKLFTHPEVLVQILKEQNLNGVLLFSETFEPLLQQHRTSLFKMVLNASMTNAKASETAVPSLYRFQPLHQLLSRIQAVYEEGIQVVPRPTHANKTRIISVYSSSGNSGKSITAVHMAKQLAFRGERVLYLSLETLSTSSQWLQGDTGRLSQLMYYLKGTPEHFGAKLELLKSHDPKLRFDYLIPHEQMREMQEMSGEHVRQLITSLIGVSIYDTIIVDLESSVHPRIVKCLELSDDIIWLVKDDCNDSFKTEVLVKQINAYPPIHYVMTGYRGSQTNSYAFLGKNMTYQLPYIPDWKVMSTSAQVWQSEIFSEQVYGMLKAVLQEIRKLSNRKEGADAYLESTAV